MGRMEPGGNVGCVAYFVPRSDMRSGMRGEQPVEGGKAPIVKKKAKKFHPHAIKFLHLLAQIFNTHEGKIPRPNITKKQEEKKRYGNPGEHNVMVVSSIILIITHLVK